MTNLSEFRDEVTISGSFESFCQPGYMPDVFREVTKVERCAFCHSNYNPNNLDRKRRHLFGACQS